MEKTNLFWFRRDLRLSDNHGLYKSLIQNNTICCFIWDSNILDKLEIDNQRVAFIAKSIMEIKQHLQKFGSDLFVLHGNIEEELQKIIKLFPINAVHCNEDYEPFAIKRDSQIAKLLNSQNISFHQHKDQVIFAKTEILNQQNRPYTVFTPYKKAWLSKLSADYYQSFDSYKLLSKNLVQMSPQNEYFNPLQDKFIDFQQISAGQKSAENRLANFINNMKNYHIERDYPALNSTSYLGVDLRFGTISVRQLVQAALSIDSEGSNIWLSELIWREFFSQILYNFPHVVHQPFRTEYNNLSYQNNKEWFEAWCNGKTGYPIVDAGMRQLNQTGFMHNRVRMICASFLCKDLLIDWRWGEAYFAKKLLDYDLASNNGNWQWCASTGCDAQPYFRIFNPYLQSEKFDIDGLYIKKYIPELAHLSKKEVHNPPAQDLFGDEHKYPKPIVCHKTQSALAKSMFAEIKNI